MVENSVYCLGYISGKAQREEKTPVFGQELVVGDNRERRRLLWDAYMS